MIFLYRFELVALDGALSDRNLSAYTGAQLPGRTVFLHTNYERPVSFDANEPFTLAFLPPELAAPVDGWLFHPERIAHEGLRFDGEKASGKLTVTLPIEHPIARTLAMEDPGASLYLGMAILDTDAEVPRARPIWSGRLSTASFDESRCTMTLSHVLEVIQRSGLTRDHPRTCPYALYDGSTCGINAHAVKDTYFEWREDGFVTGVSGDRLTLSIPEAANRPADFFKAGFALVDPFYALTPEGAPYHLPRAAGAVTAELAAKALANGGIRRSIASNNGGTVTLRTPLMRELPIGTRVSLYAGCSKLPEGCDTFNNYENYGGFADIPTKNPFESGVR